MKKIIISIILAILLLPTVLGVGPEEVCPYGWEKLENGLVRCLPSPQDIQTVQEATSETVPSMTLIDFMGVGEKIYPKSPFLGIIILAIIIYVGISFLDLFTTVSRKKLEDLFRR